MAVHAESLGNVLRADVGSRLREVPSPGHILVSAGPAVAGHISNLERPAEFNRIVEEFIGNG